MGRGRFGGDLEELNRERQRLTEQATRDALAHINAADPFIAVVHEGIRVGVAGLVAGKIAAQNTASERRFDARG